MLRRVPPALREAASAKAGPTKLVEEPRALARGAPLLYISITLSVDSRKGLKIKEMESLESKDVGSRDQGNIGLDGLEGFC